MNLTKGRKELACILLILFTISCGKNSTESGNVDEPYEISHVKKIVWTLESYEIAGQIIDLSSYAPFHLVYDDSLFLGDDGCNKYGVIYDTNGDSVLPVHAWITEMYCHNVNSFSWEHLREPYTYQIRFENNELAINTTDAIYTYRSDFLEDVDSLLIGKIWSLTSNILVTLVFDETRTFRAEYDCDDSDNSGCGTIGGIYGIGNGNTILFYETNGGGSGVEWYNYLKRILSSSLYSIENNLLILFNESDSTTFEFAVIR